MSSWRSWLNKSNPTLLDQLLFWSLRLLCLPYVLAMAVRNRLYDWKWKQVHSSSLTVVSVGNLSVGGTGKSPTVAWLARWFRERDKRVAILSRGYGKLDDGRNDEALELELKLPDVPHLQNPDRVASAMLAADELEMEVLILDDGFQHRKLSRDLDIVLIDATDSAAARWPLPAGLQRERMSSLKRAGFVIITRADAVSEEQLNNLTSQIAKYISQDRIALATHKPKSLLQYPAERLDLERLRGARVLAFCGIGNPQAFFESLRRLGAQLIDQREWPDHHAYSREDVHWLMDWHAEQADAILVCTVKDWVKIQELGPRTLLALEIDLQFLSGQLESQLDSFV